MLTFIIISEVMFVFAVYTAVKTIIGLSYAQMSSIERFAWWSLVPASAFVMAFYTLLIRIL